MSLVLSMNLYDLKTILKYSDVNLLAMSYSVPTDHISVNNVPICIEKLGCHLLLFYMLVIEHDTAFVQEYSWVHWIQPHFVKFWHIYSSHLVKQRNKVKSISILLVNDFDFGYFGMDWFYCWWIYILGWGYNIIVFGF